MTTCMPNVNEHMYGVYSIPFPKVICTPVKCRLLLQACAREGFTEASITKETYVCNLHFVGGKGPIQDYPDSVPANYTNQQVRWAHIIGKLEASSE